MKSILIFFILATLGGCAHSNKSSVDRNVASELQQYEGGFFRFGNHRGKASVAGYSVKSCDIYVPTVSPEMSTRLEKELRAKDYRVLFQNEFFEKGMSVYGFISLSEKKQLHNNENVSGNLFLRISESKAKGQFDVDKREGAIGVFGEDGLEVIHTYVPFSNKAEFLRISMFPTCFSG